MKMYVGNLSFESTENDIQDLFEPHGTVNEVHLIRFIEKPWNDHDLREAVVSILGNGKAKPTDGERLVDRADDGGIDIEFER